jgi:TonB-dependent SusC/RagA subfamily outer membrane receptor
MVEVQSVKVLKSGDAVALYGSRGAKGVILITTKKGKISPIRIDVRANSGLYVPKYYPKYLGAADYMTLYNEASKNDGIAEKYTREQIYNTSVGVNPYKYPDIGFFNSK